MRVITVLSVIVCAISATDNPTKINFGEIEKKDGYYHHYDLAILGTILAIKFKAVLVIIAVVFGIGAYFKIFSGFESFYKGNKCPPPIYHDVHSKYHHHDHGHGHADRRDISSDSVQYIEHMDLQLLSSVMKGIGLVDLNFNVTEETNKNCVSWLVCEAERMAPRRPVLGYTVSLLRSLPKRRTSESVKYADGTCRRLYSECNSKNIYPKIRRYRRKPTNEGTSRIRLPETT